jgi:GT2 family glycosyltransferase
MMRPDGGSADLGFVVVTYESGGDAEACLGSLLRLAPSGSPIVVVDNGSHDSTAEVLGLCGSRVDVRFVGRNLGFARACNLGAQALPPTDWVVLVNPDVRLTRLDLDGLRCVSLDGTVGEVAFAQSTPGRPERVHLRGFAPHLEQALSFSWGLLAPRRLRMAERFWRPQRHSRLWASGGLCAVRRMAWDEVGGFDERFFLFQEDVDLSRRLQDAGWRVVGSHVIVGVHGLGGDRPRTDADIVKLVWGLVSWLAYVRKWDGRRAARGWARAELALLGTATGVLRAAGAVPPLRPRVRRKRAQLDTLADGVTRAFHRDVGRAPAESALVRLADALG